MAMIKDMSYLHCVCDRCGIVKQYDTRIIMHDNGWIQINEEVFCAECIAYYNSIKPRVGDQIICFIEDSNRCLVKGKYYTVCDLPSSEYEKDISIYINVENGWQAKLYKTQFDLLRLDEEKDK